MGSSNKIPFNETVIKGGRIVRIRKDGTVKTDLGPYVNNTTRYGK